LDGKDVAGLKHGCVRRFGEGDVRRKTGPAVVREHLQVESDVVTFTRI
jgi:hypothetical protein